MTGDGSALSLPKLDQSALGTLAEICAVPAYSRSAVTPGIVHLGLGAFHRAHQAVVLDDCLGEGQLDWGIVGVSLKRPDTRNALAPQDNLYTVAVRNDQAVDLRVVGSLLETLVAEENPAQVFAALSDPRIRIVSLTVTEKGYYRTPDGYLDLAHPDIAHDLANPDSPRTIFGYLAGAIEERWLRNINPFTVLCCDNLPHNGSQLRELLSEFVAAGFPAIKDVVQTEMAFPSTVVDRIVPATAEVDRSTISALLGASDAWPVVTEPYLSWIIEDDFPTGRPRFTTMGVQLVADAEPYERLKLHMLNGAHSALAYVGLLQGELTVASAFSRPALRALVEGLWEEVAATMPATVRPTDYSLRLAERFANVGLRHRLSQIANDGSQKLPQRIVAPASALAKLGRSYACLSFVLAAWIKALQCNGNGYIGFDDPSLGELQRAFASSSDPVAAALNALGAAEQSALCAQVAQHLQRIEQVGIEAALAQLIQSKKEE